MILLIDSPARPRRLHPAVGSKAQNLYELARRGLKVPATHVCTWEAYARYLNDDLAIVETLKTELAARIDPVRRYAVRSSANLEDSPNFSFAGQFKSVLNAQGVEDILHAIWSIWATAQSEGVRAYLERHGLAHDALKMAVVIQEMVPAQVSGVAFSKNPLTGMNEVIVEAVRGSGAALVQHGVTPGRWVNRQGEWTAQPPATNIDLSLIQQVTDQTRAIAQAWGRPIDLEWVFDGQQIGWVQMREITSLDVDVYSNRISREMTPGLLKPLVWSASRQVNHAWMRILNQVLGPNDIRPESLTGLFYYRSYFNMGTFGRIFERMGLPRESLEQMMGIEARREENPMSGMMRHMFTSAQTWALLPRLIRFGLDKLSLARKLEAFLPAAQAQYQAFRHMPVDQLDEKALLGEIERIGAFVQGVAYYDILSIFAMQMYNGMLKRRLNAIGIDTAQNWEMGGEIEELEQFDPNVHLVALHELYGRIDQDMQIRIAAEGYGLLSRLDEAKPLQEGIKRFTEQFDYLRDRDIDLSCAPWGADPDLVLATAVRYSPPARSSPHFDDLLNRSPIPIDGSRRRKLKALYRQARRFRLYRETVGTLYKRSYNLFRTCFLALGTRLTQREIIESPEDVFYLYLEDIHGLIECGTTGSNMSEPKALIAGHKQEMARCANVVPPDTIYGDQAAPLEMDASDTLKGTPVSRGHYTGPARVVQGIQDFGRVCDGDVLIIPYSDVGWTPLFSRAGAVVAESGGMLSHSAIVAREYNIPAVVSVPGACRMADDTLVSVDGYRGQIVIHGTDVHPGAMHASELPVMERSAK
ncbi:MAG: hypothetical protein JW934_22635 [Anaerolineae bacterium]|nr:hypothetical protein [Anaerolineae bacterium]